MSIKKAIIVDDHPDVAEALLHKIKTHLPSVEVTQILHDYYDAIKQINVSEFDILFLDIELGTKTGFDLLKEINHRNFHLVVTTSHAHYAIQAVKYSAIDFLLKPIDVEELQVTYQKINEKSAEKQHLDVQLKNLFEMISSETKQKEKLVLKTQESILVVKTSEIIRCESSVNYTTFYLSDGSKKIVSKSLKEYDELLGGAGFFRAHKSHLINIEHFRSFEKRDGGYIKMSDGSSIPVSNRKKEALLQLLESL